jgi:YidC/Oxa1 family membrane protein insertase
VNKLTPVLFSGMFFFFPLPAGVLMYMVLANIFQTIQTFILSREPLPENLQKLVEAEGPSTSAKSSSNGDGDRKSLPFEPGQRSGKSNKKNEKSNKSSKKKEKA